MGDNGLHIIHITREAYWEGKRCFSFDLVAEIRSPAVVVEVHVPFCIKINNASYFIKGALHNADSILRLFKRAFKKENNNELFLNIHINNINQPLQKTVYDWLSGLYLIFKSLTCAHLQNEFVLVIKAWFSCFLFSSSLFIVSPFVLIWPGPIETCVCDMFPFYQAVKVTNEFPTL